MSGGSSSGIEDERPQSPISTASSGSTEHENVSDLSHFSDDDFEVIHSESEDSVSSAKPGEASEVEYSEDEDDLNMSKASFIAQDLPPNVRRNTIRPKDRITLSYPDPLEDEARDSGGKSEVAEMDASLVSLPSTSTPSRSASSISHLGVSDTPTSKGKNMQNAASQTPLATSIALLSETLDPEAFAATTQIANLEEVSSPEEDSDLQETKADLGKLIRDSAHLNDAAENTEAVPDKNPVDSLTNFQIAQLGVMGALSLLTVVGTIWCTTRLVFCAVTLISNLCSVSIDGLINVSKCLLPSTLSASLFTIKQNTTSASLYGSVAHPGITPVPRIEGSKPLLTLDPTYAISASKAVSTALRTAQDDCPCQYRPRVKQDELPRRRLFRQHKAVPTNLKPIQLPGQDWQSYYLKPLMLGAGPFLLSLDNVSATLRASLEEVESPRVLLKHASAYLHSYINHSSFDLTHSRIMSKLQQLNASQYKQSSEDYLRNLYPRARRGLKKAQQKARSTKQLNSFNRKLHRHAHKLRKDAEKLSSQLHEEVHQFKARRKERKQNHGARKAQVNVPKDKRKQHASKDKDHRMKVWAASIQNRAVHKAKQKYRRNRHL